MSGRRLAAGAALALAAALALTACRPRAVPGAGADTAPLHVVMINGGGSRAQNYRSHLLHVEELLDLLVRAGVPRERIAIFSADGEDPAEDLATREVQPESDFWLLGGTHLERALATRVTYANTEVPKMPVRPATREALRTYFAELRTRLAAGDTLLLYVTDHGSRHDDDPSHNTITLWGKEETLSVTQLGELLAPLDPGVRVVTLMSQCFSGAFAGLMSGGADGGEPRGNLCGYFASTADRPAYGCYPENRGRDNVGHSFHFLAALGETPRLPAAHARVLVTDQTPDVPIRTSDVYLAEVLARAARAAGEEPDAFADRMLREAWQDRGAWEPDIRLLDRVAQSFGIFSPRSLQEIDQQAKQLPEISTQLKTHGRAWKGALGDLTQANLERFLAEQPSWRERTGEEVVAGYRPAPMRELSAALLDELGPYTRAETQTASRLAVLREKESAAAAAAYRMEVRLGAVLRLRALLLGIAGRQYLATRGTPAERAAHAALAACEDLAPTGAAAPRPPALAPPSPFPPFDDDVRLAREEVLPGWMGITFRQATEKDRAARDLPEGAAAVLSVYPDSPASAAGLAPGDLVLGPPEAHFTEPRQIREWVMLSPLEEPAALDVLHGEERRRVALVPKPYPLKWPALPGPPKPGTRAPALELSAYRGTLPARLADGKPHLLFFWATWCAPCKAALPELLAFQHERRTPVIAITDESSEQLDRFFQAFTQPFPETVATDEYRKAFLAYGVSGTPGFVLVDGRGAVEAHASGYTPEKGLGLAGWSWTKRPAAPP